MKALVVAALFLPGVSWALPTATCLPVPGTQTEMHWECNATGCVVFWACQHADGTWGNFAAWGHTNEVAASAAQLVFYATEAYYMDLTKLNTALAQVPPTPDDYSDLTPLLQDLIAKYQPHNTFSVSAIGKIATSPTFTWNGTLSVGGKQIPVGAACDCVKFKLGTNPMYCSVSGDKAADGSILPANTLAACQ